MYKNFDKENIFKIGEFLVNHRGKDEQNMDFQFYDICQGQLYYISIVQFRRFGMTYSYIVDIDEYFDYYRKLKIDKIKNKII